MLIFTVCTLPARESGKRFHFWRSCLTAAISIEKFCSFSVCIDRVIIIPRYFMPTTVVLNGMRWVGISVANWFIGKHSLLETFNLYPENTLKESRVDRMGGRLDRGSLIYISRSSAYYETRCCSPCLLIPLNPLISKLWTMAQWQVRTAEGRGGTLDVCHGRGRRDRSAVYLCKLTPEEKSTVTPG